MDQFIGALSDDGENLAEGHITLDASRAFELLRDKRMDDCSYPYWKFLQGTVAYGANEVQVSLGRTKVHLEAYSDHQPPDLKEICDGLPEGNSVLEAFRSSALALRAVSKDEGAWFSEDSSRGRLRIQHLREGRYFDDGSGFGLPVWSESQKSRYRLGLIHKWGTEGSFFKRLFGQLRRRTDVGWHLSKRVPFFPLVLCKGGRDMQSSILEDQLPLEVISFSDSGEDSSAKHRPAVLAYELTGDASPARFLTEPLCNRYQVVVNNTDVHRLDLSKFPKKQIVPVLLLNLGEGEPQGNGIFPKEFKAEFIGQESTDPDLWGYPHYCKEAIFVPQLGKGTARLGVLDRGVLLSVIELDLGVPGAFVLVDRGDMKVDLGGAEIVQDEIFEKCVLRVREKLRTVIETARQHIYARHPAMKFLRTI